MLTAKEARAIKDDRVFFQVLEQIKKAAINGESEVLFLTKETGDPVLNFYNDIIKLNDKMINSLEELGYKLKKYPSNKFYHLPYWIVSF